MATKSAAQTHEFGLGAGITNFRGDISPKFNPLQRGFGIHGLYRYKLSKSITLRGNILVSNYNAQDANTTDPFFSDRRNVSIGGKFAEIAVIGEYNFLNNVTALKAIDWTPYVFGGIGFGRFSNNSNFPLEPTKLNSLVLPYGIGVKYRFKGPWSVSAEFGNRFTFSDRLDEQFGYFGTSNTNALGKINFGDLSRKDQYAFTNLTLTYTIFDVMCPD